MRTVLNMLQLNSRSAQRDVSPSTYRNHWLQSPPEIFTQENRVAVQLDKHTIRSHGLVYLDPHIMKYPSLQSTNLIVIDGRNSDDVLHLFVQGALAFLADHNDGHFLVIVSTNHQEKWYEQIGEDAGQDFFFHAETIRTSEDFLSRCAIAKVIVLPSPRTAHSDELTAIEKLKIPTIVTDQVVLDGSRFPSFHRVAEEDFGVLHVRDLLIRASQQATPW